MRKRWKLKYGERAVELDDSPSSMPVGFPGESTDDFFGEFNDVNPITGSGSSFEPLDSNATGSDAQEAATAFAFPPVAPGSLFMQVDTQDSVKYVDKSAVADTQESAKFEKVSTAVPPGIVSEALRLTDKRPLLYPWENGRLGRIFGEQGRLNLKRPKLHPGANNFVQVEVAVSDGLQLDGSVSVRHAPRDHTLYRSVVKNIVGCTYLEEREAQRDHAIRQWWDLLRLNLSMSDPGRAAVQEKGLSEVYRYGLELLDAVFGLKSPNTLLKRLCTIKLFNQWLIREYTETWLPIREQRVWAYIRSLRETKAPASRAVSLLESIRFCHFTMRVDGAQEALDSLRIKGLAAQLFATKKPWKPSDVLTVSDVEFLHWCFMDESRCEVDRIFVGHLLHMLYSRARFSDLLATTELFLDEEGAFLELGTTLHKGARSMDARSKLLPIVAPAVGIKSENWAKTYLALRQKAGLKNPSKEPAPILLAPKRRASGWDDRYITSQEMNQFIKKLFADGGRQIAGRKLTTHSMKATGLSWCSKMGVPQEHRSILARHATSVQGATVLYSRDLLSSALRSFEAVLAAIRGQTFQPDKSRSGMITPAGITPAGAPVTPFPDAAVTGAPAGTVCAPATPVPPQHGETEEVEKQWDALSVGPHAMAGGQGDYSPGTPARSPSVKLEFTWPDTEWSGDVIDLEEQHELLGSWQSGSEEESSGCSDSDDSDSFEWSEPPAKVEGAQSSRPIVPKWYINVKTNVIHETRNSEKFRCGRPLNSVYVAVPALTGLRCGTCFAHCL